MSLKKTHLYESHVKQNGKMVDFAGFKMPLWYTSHREEHLAVRSDVGVFDISHMGIVKVVGDNAVDFFQYLTTNDANRARNYKMLYTMMLNEAGYILDDLMFGECDGYCLSIVNASNSEKLLKWMRRFHEKFSVKLEVCFDDYGFLAVQGPNSAEKLNEIFSIPMSQKGKFSVSEETVLGDVPIHVLRTGYTGEDGFELVVPKSKIEKVWRVFMESGITPCGLAARDTLRMESGFPLYGQELSEKITPLMTRYRWVVKFNTDFIGKSALEKEKENGSSWATVGIKMRDKAIPRTSYKIKEGGYITSGTLSPSLGYAIAMAIVPIQYKEEGTILHVLIRGKEEIAEVVSVPFLKK